MHRFLTANPFAPLRPLDGEFLEVPQWLPGQQCEELDDRPEEDCSLASSSHWALAEVSTNTTSVTAGFTGLSWCSAGPRTTILRRPR